MLSHGMRFVFSCQVFTCPGGVHPPWPPRSAEDLWIWSVAGPLCNLPSAGERDRVAENDETLVKWRWKNRNLQLFFALSKVRKSRRWWDWNPLLVTSNRIWQSTMHYVFHCVTCFLVKQRYLIRRYTLLCPLRLRAPLSQACSKATPKQMLKVGNMWIAEETSSNFHITCFGIFSGLPWNPIKQKKKLVGGLNPSEKYESQLGWWHSQYMGT